jgi:hypothetical protein
LDELVGVGALPVEPAPAPLLGGVKEEPPPESGGRCEFEFSFSADEAASFLFCGAGSLGTLFCVGALLKVLTISGKTSVARLRPDSSFLGSGAINVRKAPKLGAGKDMFALGTVTAVK